VGAPSERDIRAGGKMIIGDRNRGPMRGVAEKIK
jgi:hypothetical protein